MAGAVCILTAYAVSVLSFYLNVMCSGLINSVCQSHPYRATTFQGISFNLCVVEKEVSGQPRVGSCKHCASAERPEQLHDDFGDLPDCIRAVSGFGESRRLALGSLFCSTFKPSNYSMYTVWERWVSPCERHGWNVKVWGSE